MAENTTKNESKKKNTILADEDDDDEEEDPFYTRIDQSGCSKYHYALQDCHFEKKDWRLCTKEMEDFRKCMLANSGAGKP